MTELQWQVCADALRMLMFLQRKASSRKRRLFACGCARRISHYLRDERSRRAVAVAERYADREAGVDELHAAYIAANAAVTEIEETATYQTTPGTTARVAAAVAAGNLNLRGIVQESQNIPRSARDDSLLDAVAPSVPRILVTWVVEACKSFLPGSIDQQIWRAESAAQCHLLRELFGNAVHLPRVEPHWLYQMDGVVLDLAQGIYKDRAFDSLPILADALEEAGCIDPEILNHLRGPGPHIRGCWALDLLLGKT